MPLGTTAGTGKDTSGDIRRKLSQEITTLSSKIEEIKTELPEPGTAAANDFAYKQYTLYFAGIGTHFINYAHKKGNQYYPFLNRGEGQKLAVKGIIDSAKKVAKLFERYGKKPVSYSQVECVMAIDYLLVELANLNFHCHNS